MRFSGLVAVASLACSAVAQLNKPWLTDPELRDADVWWRQARDMEADLPEHSYRSEDWDNNYIPEVVRRSPCIVTRAWVLGLRETTRLTPAQFLSLYYQTPTFNYSILDVETKNVFFSDCPYPNAVSRHKDSGKSWDDIFRAFSKSPIGIRSYMSNVLVVPDGSLVDVAGYAPATAAVIVSQWFHLPVIIHEGFHGIDIAAFQLEVTGRYSQWNTWWSAYDKDSHVMTEYAQTDVSVICWLFFFFFFVSAPSYSLMPPFSGARGRASLSRKKRSFS